MKKDLLPIGTVVLLEGGTRKVMICGYSSKSEDDEKIYDYNGCIFPEGFLENIYLLFDHSQIDDVCFMGYSSDKYKDYINNHSSVGISSNVGLTKDNDKKENQTHRRGRVPKAPTHPMSKSEMVARYGVQKLSDIENDVGMK